MDILNYNPIVLKYTPVHIVTSTGVASGRLWQELIETAAKSCNKLTLHTLFCHQENFYIYTYISYMYAASERE